ncbi:MAG: hypothetical protein FVQ83_10770 [Chloroflexi bacterium]|nr:hypothetical protein [Chloroflexota bacterium]
MSVQEETQTEGKIRITGSVLVVGNGAVGKSSVATMLQKYQSEIANSAEIIRSIRRTNNLEYEFLVSQIFQGQLEYSVVSQLLVPPGQKASQEGNAGRSFKQVMDIYKFHIKSIEVILLTYDLTSRESFNDLKFWLNAVDGFYNPATQFILVGTHLDQAEQSRAIPQSGIDKARQQIQNYYLKKMPDWRGSCLPVEVSNLGGDNLEELEFLIAKCILWSNGYIEESELLDSYDFLFSDDSLF